VSARGRLARLERAIPVPERPWQPVVLCAEVEGMAHAYLVVLCGQNVDGVEAATDVEREGAEDRFTSWIDQHMETCRECVQ